MLYTSSTLCYLLPLTFKLWTCEHAEFYKGYRVYLSALPCQSFYMQLFMLLSFHLIVKYTRNAPSHLIRHDLSQQTCSAELSLASISFDFNLKLFRFFFLWHFPNLTLLRSCVTTPPLTICVCFSLFQASSLFRVCRCSLPPVPLILSCSDNQVS